MKKEWLTVAKNNKRLLALIVFAVLAVVANLIGIFALNVSIVPICSLIIIEAALAVCMHNAELWVHGFLLLAQIIAGILTGNIILMIICAIIYIVALVSLEFSFELGDF